MTFLVDLPLVQVMVFLATRGLGVIALPIKTIVALADTGASVAVPACEAVTTQFPALIKFKVEPEIVQLSVGELVKEIIPPLEVDAVRAKFLLATSAVRVGEKIIV